MAHLQGVGFLLEVFEAPGANALPEDRRVPNRDLMTHGNKHMSFGVPDGKKAKAELEAMGVEIAMVAEVDDTYGVFIRDNTGNLIEIFEESGDVVSISTKIRHKIIQRKESNDIWGQRFEK